MPKIAIVTDSTTYLPEEYVSKFGIHVVPIQVIWGDDTYQDGVNLLPSEFYSRLNGAKEMPTTSQPSPADFENFYRPLLEEGFEILSIHISQKLSGTLASAIQAKQALPGKPIEIVDAKSASMGTGWAVLEAARAAKNGASLAECRRTAERTIHETDTMFVVETLEFLHRGGRIGGASRFIGTALNFKPILAVQEGAIEAVERVRTSQKARARLIELAAEKLKGSTSCRIAVIHANVPIIAEEFRQQIEQAFKPQEILVTAVSPGVGVHLGPGTLGISIQIV